MDADIQKVIAELTKADDTHGFTARRLTAWHNILGEFKQAVWTEGYEEGLKEGCEIGPS